MTIHKARTRPSYFRLSFGPVQLVVGRLVVHFTLITGKVLGTGTVLQYTHIVTVGKLRFTLPWYGIYLEVCFSEF